MAAGADVILSALPEIMQQAVSWERDQWTDGDVSESPFYTSPSVAPDATPGSLLKLEAVTDTSIYALPPATALSRFIYLSETMNSTKVPVSAYILWPYAPRESVYGHQVVAWAHGTSGFTPNTAPSHHKNLWQHYLAPYNLALQGYVVVATDYAGLGVGKTASGEAILHEYLAGPAHANDVVYSVEAAREAFPQLGKHFVVIGHSQGGAAAWSVAQRQVSKPIDGYLGAIASAPVTNILKEPRRDMLQLAAIPAIAAYYPEFNMSDVLTPEAIQAEQIVKALEATVSTSLALATGSGAPVLQSNWTQNPYIQKYQDLIVNGGKPIAKPLLVVHGEADPMLEYSVAASAVQDTKEKFSAAEIEFYHLPGVSHDPTLTASQRHWMDWIADRFAGRDVDTVLGNLRGRSARPLGAYQGELNSYLSIATQFYQRG